MKVLTVDDSRTVRQQLLRALTNAGFEVFQAEDGQKGLEVLECEKDIRFILTDLHMPVMDGIEFTKQVRKSDKYDKLPIIFLTTETGIDKKHQARQAGATGWIVKPFDVERLVDAIHRVTK